MHGKTTQTSDILSITFEVTFESEKSFSRKTLDADIPLPGRLQCRGVGVGGWN